MAEDFDSLIVALVCCALWVVFLWYCQCSPQPDRRSATATVQRLLKPRTPEDCSACRRQGALPPSAPAPLPAVRPWRELKSRRGAPKRIATDGFACPNSACAYYRITAATVHALVGYGTHGKLERIQTFRCQACGTTVTSRRDTPLYRLKTPSHASGKS